MRVFHTLAINKFACKDFCIIKRRWGNLFSIVGLRWADFMVEHGECMPDWRYNKLLWGNLRLLRNFCLPELAFDSECHVPSVKLVIERNLKENMPSHSHLAMDSGDKRINRLFESVRIYPWLAAISQNPGMCQPGGWYMCVFVVILKLVKHSRKHVQLNTYCVHCYPALLLLSLFNNKYALSLSLPLEHTPAHLLWSAV